MQASTAARDRSAGKRDAFAFSTLRREIAQLLDVMELDCAEAPACGSEPAPDHPALERSGCAPERRAFEACSTATASAPLREVFEHFFVVSRKIGKACESGPDR